MSVQFGSVHRFHQNHECSVHRFHQSLNESQRLRGVWVVESVKRETLGLGSGRDAQQGVHLDLSSSRPNPHRALVLSLKNKKTSEG